MLSQAILVANSQLALQLQVCCAAMWCCDAAYQHIQGLVSAWQACCNACFVNNHSRAQALDFLAPKRLASCAS